MKKLWGGRFSKKTHEKVEKFNASIMFDRKLAMYDVLGSLAHVQMLVTQEIISAQDGEAITEGLKEIEEELNSGIFQFNIADEDIHMNIERRLIELIGDVGKKLHTGRSRNDQVALDMQMFLRDKTVVLIEQLEALLNTLSKLADEHRYSYMPGYTHLQRAQPTTFGHYLLNYFWKFGRDLDRVENLYDRLDLMPLGSGAFAGTGFPISREIVARKLGFTKLYENSMDAVSSRDQVLELLFCLLSIMTNLSRLSEDLILWSSQEFSFVELDDAFATGSSIMPQKKNPDVLELVRGKTGRVLGHLTALATTMKALPMSYNKDLQEDKEGLFDSLETVEMSLLLTGEILGTMTVNTTRMKQALTEDFSNATDVADHLVKKGVPFRDAHSIVGQMVDDCQRRGKLLKDLSEAELLKYSDALSPEEVLPLLDPVTCINSRNSRGGPGEKVFVQQLGMAMAHLESVQKRVSRLSRFVTDPQ